MAENKLAVREMNANEISLIAHYWFTASPEHLKAMGADPAKLPERKTFEERLKKQLLLPFEKKEAYVLIWEINKEPVGHCNVNPSTFGGHGFMHLHLWDSKDRRKGIGTKLVKMSLPYFFKNMQLKLLYCEPYALNPAPNATLEKIGFKFVKEYITTPGTINFEQPVKLWEMKRA